MTPACGDFELSAVKEIAVILVLLQWNPPSVNSGPTISKAIHMLRRRGHPDSKCHKSLGGSCSLKPFSFLVNLRFCLRLFLMSEVQELADKGDYYCTLRSQAWVWL